MRIAAFLVPFFALFAGAVGFYIRTQEQIHVFVADLPERGALITYLLVAVSLLYAVFAIVFSAFVFLRRQSPRGFENAFGTDPLSYPFSFGLIGIAWLCATIMYFFELRSHGQVPLVYIYFSVLSALSAISVSYFAIEMYQEPRRKSVFALSLIPTLFMCFWLVLLYRQNASNPILLSYAYYCLAIITSALGFYFTSGFVYRKPSPPKTIFFYMLAIYFCFVTLADNHNMMINIIFGAILAMNVIYLSKLIRQLRYKQAT